MKNIISLVMEINFFKNRKNYDKKDFAQICQMVNYEYKEGGETIYKEGDQADKLYIILKGKV